MERALPWAVRVVWALMPFAAGPAFASALHDRSAPVQHVGSVGLWLAWAVILAASLVRHPLALTVVRIGVPAALAAAAVASLSTHSAATLAMATSTLATALVLLPETAQAYVNGAAYPGERRFPLRVPGPLLLGPLELAWAATIGPPAAGMLLLAARQWVAGGVLLVAGGAAAVILARALHGLSRRWLVFVPAGLVVHDPIALADPVLFRRQTISGLALAAADTEAFDLTQRALGMALELTLNETSLLQLGGREGRAVHARAVLVAPTRPGGVVREATGRRLVR
ncbi:MAG TPA: hypothetical protein VHN98_00040 [Acidimicrobiales bacterium]|nr:hypothetical protein [Acidimicrobiales bacterium]